MRIEQLIYLADIAQTGSISTTAQRVFMSQQAVSESIRSLERELGCSLLNRSKTGVTLTAKGQTAIEYAQDMVIQYHAMISALSDIDEAYDISGQMRISSSPMVNASIMPGVQKELNKQFPALKLETQTVTNDLVIQNVMNHAANLGFCYYTSAEQSQLDAYHANHPNLVLQKLFTSPLVHCVRKDSMHFSLKDHTNAIPEGLVIYFSSDYTSVKKQFHHQLTEQPVQYDSFLVSDDITLIRDLILRYDAICAMPELTYRLFFNYREYTAIPFSETISDDLYCVYDTEQYEPYFDRIIASVEREIRNILRKQLEY